MAQLRLAEFSGRVPLSHGEIDGIIGDARDRKVYDEAHGYEIDAIIAASREIALCNTGGAGLTRRSLSVRGVGREA